MPKTGESGKERRERLQKEGSSSNHENGPAPLLTRGNSYYGMSTSLLGKALEGHRTVRERRYAVEDEIENIAKKRAGRTGIMAPILQLDDTYGINELAKNHNMQTNPNTRKPYAKGGATKCYARGGGIEIKGKTKGRFV